MSATFLLLGGGAALLYLLGKGKKDADEGGPVGTTSTCIDANMPIEVARDVLDVLSNVTDPKVLADAAAEAARNGFTKAATCLQLMADKYSTGTPGTPGVPPWVTTPPVVPPGTTPPVTGTGDKPHVIRYGDIPYNMAQYYTGQGSRFRELEGPNPHIGKLTKVGNTSQYPGWQPGVSILLPASWKPWDKPTPAPLGGGGASTGTPTVPPAEIPTVDKVKETIEAFFKGQGGSTGGVVV